MADEQDKYFRPESTDLPRSIAQNPAPVVPEGQQYFDQIRTQVELVLEEFLETNTDDATLCNKRNLEVQ